jgi:hypothetical protein
MAPGALIDPRIDWQPLGEHSARGTFTVGEHSVSAVLRFNERDELVDFVSDDRLAMSPDGSHFVPQRWSTPLRDYRELGAQRVWAHGEGRWHPDEGTYTYLEGGLVDIEMNPGN